MFRRFKRKELQNAPPRTPALMASGALYCQLRSGLKAPKSKKEHQSFFWSQNNVGLEIGPSFATR
jgi:hypothetical protein